MAVRNVLEFPDPRLQRVSAPVSIFDSRVAAVAEDLIDTLHEHGSIGLSAPQIDEHQQILVMDHSEDQSAPKVFINPDILSRRRYGLIEERCLSVPDMSKLVLRATDVQVRAHAVDGACFEMHLSGMPAVCLQHEMDHFEGKLLTDRLNWFRRRRFLAMLRKRGQQRGPAQGQRELA